MGLDLSKAIENSESAIYVTSAGKIIKLADVLQSNADVLSPDDNGNQSLTVSAAGVVALTVPAGSMSATITNPGVDIRIAFGGTVASATVGTLCLANTNPSIGSAGLLSTASVYWASAATGAYVQYYK
jgi:hypothetical protein